MIKRSFDLVAALVGLVLLSPLFALIAVAITLDSRGAVFFVGQRVGRDSRPFGLHKFRSMIPGKAQEGPAITAAGDSRITRVGKLLRRTKLDELPQLINVVRGEMSLVGPRPEDPRYVALYTAEQKGVLTVRPGITSPASLLYRHEEPLLAGPDWEQVYVRQVMPDKLKIELEYLSERTFWADIGVILQTLFAVLR
jgi:lipopolysaccharide/colanic/teichoic acid biosynthesis glycosyltransferase